MQGAPDVKRTPQRHSTQNSCFWKFHWDKRREV